MKRLIVIILFCLFFSLFSFAQEEDLAKEEYAKGVIYQIASLKIKETNSPALQRAREKVLKYRTENQISFFALRIKINDFSSSNISGSIGPEDMKTALRLLTKPFYSFLEKEYKGDLKLMLEECKGFIELLWLARVHGLTESSNRKKEKN